MQNELVLLLQACKNLLECLQRIGIEVVRFEVIDLLVRQGVDDVCYFVRVIYPYLRENIAKLTHAEERRHVFQHLTKQSEVICL
ncbi:hypothetical protein NS331_03735 [Pseudacidovorax intermedius]|uniref:Uncharacterized protein n=1 Tax=Pseudacidovorax intermedius TaxID=433924 RepID=A0A147H8X6_9BURK|nr:hypothetical protein NS331_03735 [Pseudacidovorax intermedius]